MELRERIANVVARYSPEYWDWDVALTIADDAISELALTREEERVEPRASSLTKFAPHTVERYVTPWERPN